MPAPLLPVNASEHFEPPYRPANADRPFTGVTFLARRGGPAARCVAGVGTSEVEDDMATLHFICGKARAGKTALARADHLLHVIEATDAQCLTNIQRRNEEKPPGIYWGPVSDETFHAVTAYFAPPRPDEGFRIQAHASAGEETTLDSIEKHHF
jgi:hypothetical protein